MNVSMSAKTKNNARKYFKPSVVNDYIIRWSINNEKFFNFILKIYVLRFSILSAVRALLTTARVCSVVVIVVVVVVVVAVAFLALQPIVFVFSQPGSGI